MARLLADRYDYHCAGVTCQPTEVACGNYVTGVRTTEPELHVALDPTPISVRADGVLERIVRKASLWDDRPSTALVMATAHVVARDTAAAPRSVVHSGASGAASESILPLQGVDASSWFDATIKFIEQYQKSGACRNEAMCCVVSCRVVRFTDNIHPALLRAIHADF